MAAALDLGTLAVRIRADGSRETEGDLEGVNDTLRNTENQARQTERQVTSMSNNLGNMGSKLSKIGSDLTLKVTTPILALGAAAFKLGSDFGETLSKTEETFGKNAEIVKEWSGTALESMGMAKQSAMDMAALFGDMGSGMGLESDIVLEYSQNLTQLAADVASFKNVSVDRAKTALTGVYTGETEALKSLGVVMTEVNLQEYAYSQGIKTKVQDMNQAEKVQLRYNYVMSVTANSQGDFARTIDSSSNQARIFVESLKELGASFQDVLLPTFTPFITKANELIKSFAEMDKETKQQIVQYALLAAAVGPAAKAMGGLMTAIDGVKKVVTNIDKFFNVYTLALTAVAFVIGTVVTALYKQKKAQEELNQAIIETIRLKSDMSAADNSTIADYQAEQSQLKVLVGQYDNLSVKVGQYEAEMEKLSLALQEGTLSNMGFEIEIDKLNTKYGDIITTFGEVKDSLKEKTGSVDNARLTIDAYTERIKNAEEAEKILSQTTDVSARSLAEQSLKLQGNAVYASNLALQYEGLSKKESLNAQEKDLLKQVTTELIKTMGDSVVSYNSVTGAVAINLGMVQKEIGKTDELAKAKMDAVNAMNAKGKEGVESLRQDTIASIKLIQTQIMALQQAGKAMEGSQWGYSVSKDIGEKKDEIQELESYIQELDDFMAEVNKGPYKEEEKGKGAKKDPLDEAIKLFEQKKALGEITVEEEFKNLEAIKAQHGKNAESIVKINDYAQQVMLGNIQERIENEQLTAEEARELYEEIRDNFCLNETDKRNFNKLINESIIAQGKELVADLKDLSKEELEKKKEQLLNMRDLYKDNEQVVKELDKDILATKKEIYTREVDELRATVDALIKERRRLYQEEKDLLDDELQDKLSKYQAQLDAMDREDEENRKKEKNSKFTGDIDKLYNEIATTEDEEARLELQEKLAEKELEYQAWLLEEKRKAERQSIKDAMQEEREASAEKKKKAEEDYETDMEGYETFYELEEEKIKVRMETAITAEAEVTRKAAENLLTREKDLLKSMQNQELTYRNQVPIIASIATEYGNKLLEGLTSTEGKIDEFISRKVSELEDAINSVSFDGSASGGSSSSSSAASTTTVNYNVTQNIANTSSSAADQQRASTQQLRKLGMSY